jgi:hypothetical protein
MATRKKKPWNHGLRIPGLGGEPEHPLPKPMPIGSGPMGLTTGMMVPTEPQWECLRCERLKLGKEVDGLDHIRQCPWRDTGLDPALG